MINLRPAKSVQGKFTLPVSPDLLFMAALGACAASRKITITGVNETDVINDIIRALHGHVSVELDDSALRITPLPDNDDPVILLALPESLLPYRVIYMFMGLGMGKTVVSRSTPQRQLHDFIAQAKRIGITVETVEIKDTVNKPGHNHDDANHSDDTQNAVLTGLKATYFDDGIAESACPNEDDCAALLAFLFGNGKNLTFTIADYHLSTPLRQLAHAFGFAINAKANTANDADDPIARRLKFLRSKQRDSQTPSQTYTVEANFAGQHNANQSLNDNDNTDNDNTNIDDTPALNITVPGDDILAAALISLKCLVHKGDLEISNVPLESWATQALSFVKKMGGKVVIQENGKTAFGLRGTVSVKKSECVGRKVRCVPLYQFIGQLPCMAVASAFAEGKSVFRELGALRLFEPDGLDLLEKCLRPLGARHGEMPDGIVVEGAKEFDGFDISEPLPAHIAVAFCVAGIKCMGKTSIAEDFIKARWPDFEKIIGEICEFRNK